MKIYTKTGDKGNTSLIGGKRVPKYHDRIEAYGTIDELISHTGLLRDLINNKNISEKLVYIQHCLMHCATILASENNKYNNKQQHLSEKDIIEVEKEIDRIEKNLKPMKSFILPGGHPAVSQCHIARTVCRRAERKALILGKKYTTDPIVIRFLNRLSDYFFVLARYIAKINKVKETPWTPEI